MDMSYTEHKILDIINRDIEFYSDCIERLSSGCLPEANFLIFAYRLSVNHLQRLKDEILLTLHRD